MSNSATTKPSPKEASTQGAGTAGALDKKGDATSPGGTMKKQVGKGTTLLRENYASVSSDTLQLSQASAQFSPEIALGLLFYAASAIGLARLYSVTS